MIHDPDTGTIVGNLGWVDKGSLWVYSLRKGKSRSIPIGHSRYLGVKLGAGGLFRLAHHEDPNTFVSIRHVGEPELELAAISFEGGRACFSGDDKLWSSVDSALVFHTGRGARLLWIDASAGDLIDLDLSWYNSENYDLGYQGLVDCISCPAIGLIAVGVQRSSTIVLIDQNANQHSGAIQLADRAGNPSFRRLSSTQLLTSDYDTLCVVDMADRTTRCSAPIQPPQAPNYRQFIGNFDAVDQMCAVARPFSGDAVLIDIETFKVCAQEPVAGQPLALCMTSESSFITRDWKTGRVEVGSFRRRLS